LALRWFRTRKTAQDAAPEGAAAPEVEAPPEVAPAEAPEAEGPTEPAKKRRRRGSRGGRGRKKSTAQGTGAEPDEASSEGEDAAPRSAGTKPARKTERKTERKADRKPERKGERKPARGRRRTPTKRAALPDAKRELLISVDVGEQRVAILEDDVVAEVYLERPERRSIAGNIYLGVVDNVLPGMEAAFVEIGLEKNGFLYVDEIVVPELEGRKGAKKIQDLIKRGQTVLVQAVKDPMKSKGARLTTEISLPGRFLVYVPNGEGSGVSRRLDDQERTRLKEIVKGLDPKGGGIIVRTAAEGASAEDIERDLVFLQRLWKTIQTKTKTATAPSLVYEEAELPLRIVRDLFAGDFVGAQIDDDRTYRRIVSYLKKTSPHMIERVHRYKEKAPLFEASGVEQEINSTLERRVNLPSGGYLVFDYAEAFTVIDVNTGRFVGSRAKGSSGRLEDTIVKNNLEAVKEVVRQLRLRDIGGIIVIDFIDMSNPKNRETVEEALRTELERDRTKTYVVEISPLGLVEMTRQNVTDGPREILTTRCAVCAGDGFVVSEATHALEVERRLRELAKGSRVQGFRVAVHPRVLSLLAGPGGSRLEAIEAAARRRFFLVPAESANGHVHLDHFEVLKQGKLDTLRPTAPFEEGATLELKLVEVGLYDPTAGVGKVDGAEVVVAGAAKLVGKKLQVKIGRVLEGTAFAIPADVAAVPAAITFEAEAEKPTRGVSAKKAVAETAEPELVEAEASEPDLADEPAAAEDAVELELATEGDEAAADAAPKKRTRRGSRGGRGRKKTTATATADDAPAEDGAPGPEEEPEEEPEAAAEPAPKPARAAQGGRKRTPRIHVPAADIAAPAEAEEPVEASASDADGDEAPASDGQAPKKRTRRGTRGGRKRRKPSANGQATAGEDAATEPVEVGAAVSTDPAEPAEADEPYVPMSEWIEDFDRPR
jgi:ribonuclease G